MNPTPDNLGKPVPEDHWIPDDHLARHPDDTPAWPITASLLSDAIHRFFTFILPAAAIGFLILLTAWLAI